MHASTILDDAVGWTMKGLRWAIQEALRRAGCAAIKPYSLRGATALMENGMDVSYIQRLLGHVLIQTTVTYLRIGEQALRACVAEAHPRRKWGSANEDQIQGRPA